MRGTPVLPPALRDLLRLAPILTLDAVHGRRASGSASTTPPTRPSCTAPASRRCLSGQTRPALGARHVARPGRSGGIILPQALRVALPGVANDFIALLKDSSLVSVITVVELTKQMTITAVDVRGWLAPGLLCAALYLAMSYPLSRLARRLERRLAPVPA
jgi:hypothetical protein